MQEVPDVIRKLEQAADRAIQAQATDGGQEETQVTESPPQDASQVPDAAAPAADQDPQVGGKPVLGVEVTDPRFNQAEYWRHRASVIQGQARAEREKSQAGPTPERVEKASGLALELESVKLELEAMKRARDKDAQTRRSAQDDARVAADKERRAEARRALQNRYGDDAAIIEDYMTSMTGKPRETADDPEATFNAFVASVDASLTAAGLASSEAITTSPQYQHYASSLVRDESGKHTPRGEVFIQAVQSRDTQAATAFLKGFMTHLASGQQGADDDNIVERKVRKRDPEPATVSVDPPVVDRGDKPAFTRAQVTAWFKQTDTRARSKNPASIVLTHPITGSPLSAIEVDRLETDILAASTDGRIHG